MPLIYHNYKPSYYPYSNRGWRDKNIVIALKSDIFFITKNNNLFCLQIQPKAKFDHQFEFQESRVRIGKVSCLGSFSVSNPHPSPVKLSEGLPAEK